MLRVAATAMTLVVFFPVFAVAEPLEIINCRSGTVNVLHAEKDLTVNGFELKGVSLTRNANKALDNSSSICVGVARSGAGDSASHGYCKYIDTDGDVVMVEWHGRPPKGGSWSFLGGTGKWAGVQGKGDWDTMPPAKSLAPGTVQACNLVKGEYTLRK